MEELKKQKKCDKKCHLCNETNCPDDYRAKCYGSKCQAYKFDCKLKADGTKLIEEIRRDKYLQHGGKINTEMRLLQQFDLSTETVITESDPIRNARHEAIRQVVFFYLEHPAEFDKFVMEFFLDKKQSDLAKERGVTRQAISKMIRIEKQDNLKKEIAELKKRNAAFAEMTVNELKVYQLCGEHGILNISSVAKQSGLSRPTIYRILHNLSEKYGICFTLNNCEKRK